MLAPCNFQQQLNRAAAHLALVQQCTAELHIVALIILEVRQRGVEAVGWQGEEEGGEDCHEPKASWQE